MSKVLVETSARHVHVSRADLDILFGEGYELTPKKDLSQPGQFACEDLLHSLKFLLLMHVQSALKLP